MHHATSRLHVVRTPHLVCVQMTLADREEFAALVRRFVSERSDLRVHPSRGPILLWSVVDSSPFVDARSPTQVAISLTPDLWLELAEAVEEHLQVSGFDLDHALEPLGVTFQPANLKDLVFETTALS